MVLLPFQELSYRTGATFSCTFQPHPGRPGAQWYNLDEVITERTKVVAVTHVGNATVPSPTSPRSSSVRMK